MLKLFLLNESYVMNKRNVILLLFSLLSCVSIATKFDLKPMFEGMGQVITAPGYVYNYKVFSDASVPIYIEHEGMASFMGAIFPSSRGMFGARTLPSIFDTPDGNSQTTYLGQVYYFNMYISDDKDVVKNHIYKEAFTHLPLEKNDKKIYYYHVYTQGGFKKGSSMHKPAVEMMGYQDPTQLNDPDATKHGNVKFSEQLSQINFYNSSDTDVQISLTYGTSPYSFTVEKYSYSYLGLPTKQDKKDDKSGQVQADLPAFSLRPNKITFSAYNQQSQKYDQFRSLSLPATGFDGVNYTIEIFKDPGKSLEVGIQGFNPGNYDLAVTDRVRDVTPCPCTFWYQSNLQAGSVPGYTDLPGQIWVIYQGKDSPIISQVTPGQVVTWNLTRPWLSQGDQFVYFVYVVTTDDAVAQKFVEKFGQQILGKNIYDEYVNAAHRSMDFTKGTQTALDISGKVKAVEQTLTSDQEIKALMGSLNIANGVIEDTDQGVIGYLVGADIFTPKGLGFGRFYYTLAPSILNFNGIASLIFSCLDSKKTNTLGGSDTDVQKSIAQTINSWFGMLLKKPQDLQPLIEKYLIQFGDTQVVDVKSGQLTQYGKSRLQAIISGNMSLKYPSMKLSTVTNQYVYDFGKSAPDKMPNAATALPFASSLTQQPQVIQKTVSNQKVIPKSTLMKKAVVSKTA